MTYIDNNENNLIFNTKGIRPAFSAPGYINYLKSIRVNKLNIEIIPLNLNFHFHAGDNSEKYDIRLVYKSGENIYENFRPIVYVNQQDRLGYATKQYNERIAEAHIAAQKLVARGDAIIFDIKNAFGSVCLETLKKIIGNSRISEYIDQIYARPVYYNDYKITWQNGLYQGLDLSKSLFLIYMDYIFDIISKYTTDYVVYMDDIIIAGRENYNRAIEILGRFNMHVNEKKLHFKITESTLFLKLPLLNLREFVYKKIIKFDKCVEKYIEDNKKNKIHTINYKIKKYTIIFQLYPGMQYLVNSIEKKYCSYFNDKKHKYK